MSSDKVLHTLFSFPMVLVCILVIYQNLSPGFGFSCWGCWGYWGFFFKYSNFHFSAIILLVSSCFDYILNHPPHQKKTHKSQIMTCFFGQPIVHLMTVWCPCLLLFEEFFTAVLCFVRFNSSWPVSPHFCSVICDFSLLFISFLIPYWNAYLFLVCNAIFEQFFWLKFHGSSTLKICAAESNFHNWFL